MLIQYCIRFSRDPLWEHFSALTTHFFEICQLQEYCHNCKYFFYKHECYTGVGEGNFRTVSYGAHSAIEGLVTINFILF